jgi:hypothetical protein
MQLDFPIHFLLFYLTIRQSSGALCFGFLPSNGKNLPFDQLIVPYKLPARPPALYETRSVLVYVFFPVATRNCFLFSILSENLIGVLWMYEVPERFLALLKTR